MQAQIDNNSSSNRSIVSQFWDKEWQISSGLTLSGYSRAADRTGFSIKELGVFLDAGVSSYRPPKYCFITHCHADHCFQLPMIMVGTRNMNIYLPEVAEPFVDRHIESTFCMNNCNTNFDKSWYNLQVVKPNETIQINCSRGSKQAGRKFNVLALEMDHTVPSLGYAFKEVRQRLAKQFQGLNGCELKELRQNGIDLNEEYEKPMFVFMGDTSIHGLLNHRNLLIQFPVIIVECTFLHDEHRGHGEEAKKHIAWSELSQVILQEDKSIQWVLIHFSMRYTSQEIKQFFDQQFEKLNLKNVLVWI